MQLLDHRPSASGHAPAKSKLLCGAPSSFISYVGVAEDHDAFLVAPRLDHHRADGDVQVTMTVHSGQYELLGVPLVAGRPQPQHPRRQLLRAAHLVEEGTQHGRRVAVVDRHVHLRLVAERHLDRQFVRCGHSDVVPGAAGGPDVEAPARAADHVRERHRQVGPAVFALRLVLLEHHRVEPPATLVDGVVPLAETDHVLARCERQREPGPVHPGRRTSHSTSPACPTVDRADGVARSTHAGDTSKVSDVNSLRVEAVAVGPTRLEHRRLDRPATLAAERTGLRRRQVPLTAGERGSVRRRPPSRGSSATAQQSQFPI